MGNLAPPRVGHWFALLQRFYANAPNFSILSFVAAETARSFLRAIRLIPACRNPVTALAPQQGIRPGSEQKVEERRKFLRSVTDEPAYISLDGSVMSCVLRNISPEGAAIDVENPAFVPARFRLVVMKDNSVHECTVAWIRQKRIGLTFVVPPEAGS
jgi:hypothetical protein